MEFPCQAERNPHFEEVREHYIGWATRMGLAPTERDRRRLEVGDYALLCAYFYPRAPKEKLALATEWIAWEFILDDLFSDTYQSSRDLDGARRAASRLVPLLPTRRGRMPVPDNPVEAALIELWERTIDLMSPTWRARFFGQVQRFCQGFVLETSDLAWGRTPDLVDHIQSRREASGGEPMFELLEFTMDFEIPAELCDTRPIRVIRQSLLDSVMYVNDLFSLRKERSLGDVHNNVYLVGQLFGCDQEQAAEYVERLANSSMRLHESVVENELPAILDEYHVDPATRAGVLRWADLTRYWMAGNVAWHQETRRYTVVELW